jgi:arylsulfatase A-like enzyme
VNVDQVREKRQRPWRTRRWGACRAIGCSAAVACAAVLGCRDASPPPRQPHPIIIVDIDTLRADHLGCYGYQRETSPHIDAFARETVFFEWAFSQAPNTPPSQTSILTGLYPSTHGMILDDDRVPEEAVTLAEALAGHGYVTAGFHDGGYMREFFRIGQGFSLWDDSSREGLKVIGPKVESWLREHAAENFLLLIHTYDPHTPYAPPPPFDAMFMEGVPEPTPGFEPTTKLLNDIRLSKFTKNRRSLPPNDLAYAMALYDGEIRFVDDWFGSFWGLVRELGLDRRATIVFLSDHGEEFQEHGSLLHEKLYATVTRIPLMIRLPGGRLARRVPAVVESVDLMPTLLELAGAPVPAAVQGGSLLPLMLGQPAGDAPVAFGEYPWFGRSRAVTLGTQRLVYASKTGRAELYNYRTDPLEQVNVAERHPEAVAARVRLLESWEARVAASRIEDLGEPAPVDQETIEQLRQLGYVQ